MLRAADLQETIAPAVEISKNVGKYQVRVEKMRRFMMS